MIRHTRAQSIAALTASLLLSISAGVIGATTMAPRTQPCPLCGGENQVWHVLSMGGYVYDWPSKTEYVFWPFTEESSLFTCRHCSLTCFVCDLEELPADKHEAIRSALKTISPPLAIDGKRLPPIVARLLVAESVYRAWDRDSRSMCHFYRIAGYHYAHAGMIGEASVARRKALEQASRLLESDKLAGAERREMLVVSAAMRQLLGDDLAAARDLGQSLLVRRSLSEAENYGFNFYLLRLTLHLASRNSFLHCLASGSAIVLAVLIARMIRRVIRLRRAGRGATP